ncbi:putative ankyrin repeat protein [Botrytis cinerea BcDW1]|uniref:Putative ankyrin repeat protein n=1 Tax=Botryotinia fuckeliana (strain BcDW1) TaxID=1290391 RepID=M7U3C7_BOTF1|nr:putative ankyrin repeat protein [Botrytis cinerea BcDW1]
MASVGDVITLVQIAYKATKHIQDILHASQDISELQERLKTLIEVLESLDRRYNDLNDDYRKNLDGINGRLKRTIKDLQTKLDVKRKSWRFYKLRFFWPLKKRDLDDILKKIDGLRGDLQLVLTNSAKEGIDRIQAAGEETKELQRRADERKRMDQVIEKLRSELQDELSTIPQRVEGIVKGSGEWIFREHTFMQWEDSEDGILWVNGLQGSGKTGLMTSYGKILKEKAGNPPEYQVARVFCDHKTLTELSNHFEIIMSLWGQIFDSVDFKMDLKTLKDLEKKLGRGRSRIRSLSLEEERDLKIGVFRQTMTQVGKTILILDGLDEVPEKLQRVLIEDLKTIQKCNKYCRVIVTSRPYKEIGSLFEGDPQFRLKARKMDIKLYIGDRISKEGQGPLKRPEMIEYVTNSLTERSKGIFLMAKLCMDEIVKAATEYECGEMMKELPQSLNDAYFRGLQRLAGTYPTSPNHNPQLPCQAIQALFWVVFAKTPLTEQQLRHALAVGEGDIDYDSKKEFDVDVDDLCGKLLEVKPGSMQVRVAHKSIADYLKMDATRERWFPTIREHIHITLMRFLLFPCMTEGSSSKNVFEKWYGLVVYAINNCGKGLNRILEPKTPLWEITERFLKTHFDSWNTFIKNETINMMSRQSKYWPMSPEALTSGSISNLHLVVTFDLPAFVPIIVDFESLHPRDDHVLMTPLGLAIAQDRFELVKALLERKVPVNVNQEHGKALRPPLYDAVYHRNENMTRLLLASGADMTLRRIDNDQSPLDLAYSIGRGMIASVLAEFISSQASSAKPQELQFLVRGAFLSELKLVIDKGIFIDHPCENGKRLLDYANELGNQSIIDLLILNNATPLLAPQAIETDSSLSPSRYIEPQGSGSPITEEKTWGLENSMIIKSSKGVPNHEVESVTGLEHDLDDIETSSENFSIYLSSEPESVTGLEHDLDGIETNSENFSIYLGSEPESSAGTDWAEEDRLERHPSSETEADIESRTGNVPTEEIGNSRQSSLERSQTKDESGDEFGSNAVIGTQTTVDESIADTEQNVGEDECLHDESALLLEILVDDRLQLPVQRIVFESLSRDQGWSSHSNEGTYLGSSRSWIDVCTQNQDKRSQSFSIQHNVHASKEFRLHTNVWDFQEMKKSSPARAQFIENISAGDKLQVFAHAQGGVGWRNYVAFIRARVYGMETKEDET